MRDTALSILLVSDSQDTVADIVTTYTQHSPRSTLNIVHNLVEARAFLSQNTPDIALVRYQLSDGNAPELIDERISSFPLILLIEDGQQAEAELALLKGCFDYLKATKANLAGLPELLPLHRQIWLLRNKLDQAERLAKLGFWEWDEMENRLTYASEGYARMLEMTPAEVMANLGTEEQDQRYFHQDDVARYRETEAKAGAAGEGVDIEYRIYTATGRLRHVHEISEVVIDDSGRFISYSGVVQDITDRKLAQEELTKTLADARRAEHLVKLGTYEWDWASNGGLVACSEEYARIQEMTVSEALQAFNSVEDDWGYIHPDDREEFKVTEAEALAKGEGYRASYRMLLPSGRIRHIREVCEVELNDQGKVVRSVGSMQDVSEQVELEEQLRHSQKMEAVGQLAGGVAHDFNNLLTVINGYSELHLNLLNSDDPLYHDLSEIKKAGERAAALTRQLLAFSRKQILQPKVIDLGKIVAGMEDMVKRLIGEHIDLDVQRDPKLNKTKADPGQIEQVIMNLLVNARNSMPNGGHITIVIKNVALDEDAIATLDGLQHGDCVMISVSDNGVGIAEDILPHIFEPFYTTKGVDEGTGLGLSTVFGIVKQSGGGIEVESKPGNGSTFRIYLPKVETSDSQEETDEHIDVSVEGDETILLVEDDDSVRELLTLTLEQFGYVILSARDGEGALVTARRHKGPIALMITDIVMPRMSRHELAKIIAPLQPKMSVLYISGYDDDMASDQGIVDVENAFLQKPFSPTDIARKVRTILDNI